MDNKFKQIYKVLSDKKYHTAKKLARTINVSEKTCRTYIKIMNTYFSDKNLKISSKPRYGYILVGTVDNENLFNVQNFIPQNSFERCIYILELLLSSNQYIKLEKISESIFIGSKSITQDLKKIEQKISKYDLYIERKPYYGLKIIGSEFSKRNCLIDLTETKLNENIFSNEFKNTIDSIATNVTKFFDEMKISISDLALQNFITVVYITLLRFNKNLLISEFKLDNSTIFIEKKAVIKSFIQSFYPNILNHDNEINFLTLHFLSSITIHDENIHEIKQLIDDIYYYINLTFKIDLYSKVNLYNILYTHLIALNIRLRFKINVTNPILEDIKRNIPFVYNIASFVGDIIAKRYNSVVFEDEIGFLAVILNIGINEEKICKKNILIVCPNGRGISKFLVHKYKMIFENQLNIIHTCGYKDLKVFDLTNVDYIFSLIDIDFSVNKPIYRIDYFLNNKQIEKIKEVLSTNDKYIQNVFNKSLFFHIKEKITKEQLIHKVSQKLKNVPNIPTNIEKLILEREKLGLTEISDNIAIPHPIESVNNVNVVSFCILDHSIKWIDKKVNIVMFLLLNNSQENEQIYQIISNISDNKNFINYILKYPTYDNFLNLINNIKGGEHVKR